MTRFILCILFLTLLSETASASQSVLIVHSYHRGIVIERNPLPSIHIPRTFLLQIFDNLIGNAVRYDGRAWLEETLGGGCTFWVEMRDIGREHTDATGAPLPDPENGSLDTSVWATDSPAEPRTEPTS